MASLPAVLLTVSPAAEATPLPDQAIPEYAPVQAVLLSEDLFQYGYHAEEILQAITDSGTEAWIATENAAGHAQLKTKLGELKVPAKALDHTASLVLPHGNIWLRDYAPLPILTPKGLAFADLRFDGAAKTMDDFPRTVGKKLGVPVRKVPLALDGGDFLTNGVFCFTSSPDLQKPKDVQAVKAQLGCREIVAFPDAPHAHIDMWAKVVDDRTVLVNQLDEKTLGAVQALYGNIPDDIRALKDNLDAQATRFARHMKVVRLPMPIPYRRTFRTYANALLVNGTAIVPSYDRFGWQYDEYPDKDLKAHYETTVRKTYESLGYKVRMINADGLLYNGGAFHCVTATIPALKGH